MKTLAIGALAALLVVAAATANVSPAHADHPKAEVIMTEGSECEYPTGCFSPGDVTVDVGGTVTWKNDGDLPHTATSGASIADKTDMFDTGFMTSGTVSEPIKFDEAGVYEYHCSVHPTMVGTITVEGGSHGDDDDMMDNMDKDMEMMDKDKMDMMDNMDKDDHGHDMEMMDNMMVPQTTDEVMATITTGDGVMGSPMSIDVKMTDMDGNVLEHVNYKLTAMQGDQILFDEEIHNHMADESFMTAPLMADASDDMPVDVKVELMGFGVEEPYMGATGQVASTQVVPEFGAIAMMILGVSIVSIIAVTARSRLIPRI